MNEIGWKLCYLNDILVSKRGLLQRAVDRYQFLISYRNAFPDSKSRRVARVEKTQEGFKKRKKKEKAEEIETPIKRTQIEKIYIEKIDTPTPISSGTHTDHISIPKYRSSSIPLEKKASMIAMERTSSNRSDSKTTRLIVETVCNSKPYQIRLKMNIDSIPDSIDREFILLNQPFQKPKNRLEILCNSIAWKLAYLNPEYLDGNIELLQRSVDVYLELFEDEEFKPRSGKRMMKQVFG